MISMKYRDVFPVNKTAIIGMIHLLPLPGHEKHTSMDDVIEAALSDAKALLDGGINHAIIENDGNRPFGIANQGYDFSHIHKGIIKVGLEIHREFPKLATGVQILQNYGETPKVTAAFGGMFIRSQLYWDVRLAPDTQVIEPCYKPICKSNKDIGAVVLADLDPKETKSVGPYNLENSIRGILSLGYKSDALITTGSATGSTPDKEQVKEFKQLVRKYDTDIPIGVGSGVTPEAIKSGLLEHADFAIVGTALKTNSRVDTSKVRNLMDVLEATSM